ncbi:MAG: right-handed parallel beta-helix repeat-containing protein [Anaerolineae bacterium]|nr:right-handed parallel beta-helix repeat-containing protein [Anaerolineae bacterium]
MKKQSGALENALLVVGVILLVGIVGFLAFIWWHDAFGLSNGPLNSRLSEDNVVDGVLVTKTTTQILTQADGTVEPKLTKSANVTCIPIDITNSSIATLTATLPVPPATTKSPVSTAAMVTPTLTPTVETVPIFTLTPTLTHTLIPTTASATSVIQRDGNTYYVSLSGNDQNPGTQQQPWRSVRKAANTAIAGDTVIVREGSYKEMVEFRTSGVERIGVSDIRLTNGNMAIFPGALNDVQPGDSLYVYFSRYGNNGIYLITEVGHDYIHVAGASFIEEAGSVRASIATPVKFQAAAGEAVTLDLNFEDSRGSPARFMSVSYVVLDGFQVTRSLHAGVSFDRSHHNVFQNGDIFNNGRPGVYIFNGSTYNMIVGNRIHNNGVYGPGEAVYIGKSPQDGGPDSAHATHVLGNHVYNVAGDEGADVKPGIQNTVIAHNVYENCSSTWGVVIIGDQSSNSLVYGNILRGNSGSDRWAGAITVHGPDNLVYNNLVINNSGLDGIYLFKFPGNKVYHNTVYGHDVGIGFDGMGPGLSGTEVANNLLSQNQQQIAGNSENAVIDCNLIDGASQVLGTNPVQAVPLFANPSAGDFRLAVGSPAVDICSDRGIHLDINRLLRPIGNGYDIGAYEYSGG